MTKAILIALAAISIGFGFSSVKAEDLDGADLHPTQQDTVNKTVKIEGVELTSLHQARYLQDENPGNLDKLIAASRRKPSTHYAYRRTGGTRVIRITKIVNNGLSPSLKMEVDQAYKMAQAANDRSNQAVGRANEANANASNSLVGVWQAKVQANYALNAANGANSNANNALLASTANGKLIRAAAADKELDHILMWLIPLLPWLLALGVLLLFGKALLKKLSSAEHVDQARQHANSAAEHANRAERHANVAVASNERMEATLDHFVDRLDERLEMIRRI